MNTSYHTHNLLQHMPRGNKMYIRRLLQIVKHGTVRKRSPRIAFVHLSDLYRYQQACCCKDHHWCNSIICDCCSLRLKQRRLPQLRPRCRRIRAIHNAICRHCCATLPSNKQYSISCLALRGFHALKIFSVRWNVLPWCNQCVL